MKPTRTGIVIADRSRAHILLNEGLVKGFDRVQRGLPISWLKRRIHRGRQRDNLLVRPNAPDKPVNHSIIERGVV